ncbi:MAG: AraC family transcriptional regulator [Lachnospiraceae bacterium]|nr:AraC family transcriptional regulator [Lachnospiraceae bacterium]
MEAGLLERAYGNYKFANINRKKETTVYYIKQQDGTGTGRMETCDIFPGVQISFNSLSMDTCFQQIRADRGFWEIDYCSEGCYEMGYNDQKVAFLKEKMLSVTDLGSQVFTYSRIPFREYHGISILLELEKVQPILHGEFAGSGICFSELAEIMRLDRGPYLMRPLHKIEAIFKELENRRNCRGGDDIRYFWLKTVELLLYLSKPDQERMKSVHSFDANTGQGIREVYQYILEHPFEHITIPELADMFRLAESSMKRCFKYSTGKSIGSFQKERRMEAAAELLLKKREWSVGEIAEAAGYENQSKFSAAFKSVYRETPLAFRRCR